LMNLRKDLLPGHFRHHFGIPDSFDPYPFRKDDGCRDHGPGQRPPARFINTGNQVVSSTAGLGLKEEHIDACGENALTEERQVMITKAIRVLHERDFKGLSQKETEQRD
jgi:hypothetical protein